MICFAYRKVTFSNFFQIASATDHSNFDAYPGDDEIPADDVTGWDKDF